MLPREEEKIAAHIGVSLKELRLRFETSRWRFPSLRERHNGRCIMNGDDGRCKIYICRPLECQTWPFWPELLDSPEAWSDAAKHCPGMNTGPLRSYEGILAVLAEHIAYVNRLTVEWGRSRSFGGKPVGAADRG